MKRLNSVLAEDANLGASGLCQGHRSVKPSCNEARSRVRLPLTPFQICLSAAALKEGSSKAGSSPAGLVAPHF